MVFVVVWWYWKNIVDYISISTLLVAAIIIVKAEGGVARCRRSHTCAREPAEDSRDGRTGCCSNARMPVKLGWWRHSVPMLIAAVEVVRCEVRRGCTDARLLAEDWEDQAALAMCTPVTPVGIVEAAGCAFLGKERESIILVLRWHLGSILYIE